MEIRGLTVKQLELAAERTPVTLYNCRHVGSTRMGAPKYRLQLHTDRDSEGRVVYGRLGFHRNKDGNRRRCPGPVCWHGHRDFMRACFEQDSTAIIITAIARYNGLADFERKYQDTAYRNVGSLMDPAEFGSLCECDDDAGIYWRETKRQAAKREKAVPICAQAMGCLCAGHARGNSASDPCDTTE